MHLKCINTKRGKAKKSRQRVEKIRADFKQLLIKNPNYFGNVTVKELAQKYSVIGSLGDFCVNELDDFFISLKPSEWAPQWDKSKALQKYSSKSIRLRSWGHSIIVIIPSVLGLAINWNHAL